MPFICPGENVDGQGKIQVPLGDTKFYHPRLFESSFFLINFGKLVFYIFVHQGKLYEDVEAAVRCYNH